MNVGIFCEGSIDFHLLGALLKRIARVRARIDWPVQPRDAIEEIRIRKRGFGQIEKAIRRCLKDDTHLAKYEFIVVVLDANTRNSQEAVRRLFRGRRDFVLGVAHQEIEAWWLADRSSVLEWLQLRERDVRGTRYALPYDPERDDNPKQTLDELTELSSAVQSRYGEGNTDLATEFARSWSDSANLGRIATSCPKGFAPFDQRSAALFAAAKRKLAR
jgi:hypothetical protein